MALEWTPAQAFSCGVRSRTARPNVRYGFALRITAQGAPSMPGEAMTALAFVVASALHEFRLGEKGEVAGTGGFDLGDAGDVDAIVAFDRALQLPRQLAKGHSIENITRSARPFARRSSRADAVEDARRHRRCADDARRGRAQTLRATRTDRGSTRSSIEFATTPVAPPPRHVVAQDREGEEVAEHVGAGNDDERHREQQAHGVKRQQPKMSIGVAPHRISHHASRPRPCRDSPERAGWPRRRRPDSRAAAARPRVRRSSGRPTGAPARECPSPAHAEPRDVRARRRE